MIHDRSFPTYERNCLFSVYGLNYSFFEPNEYAKLEFLLRFLFLSFLPFLFFFIFTSSYYLVLDETPAGRCKSRRSSRKNSAENKTLSWQNKPREGSSLKWKSLGTAINPTGTLKICSVWRCAILFSWHSSRSLETTHDNSRDSDFHDKSLNAIDSFVHHLIIVPIKYSSKRNYVSYLSVVKFQLLYFVKLARLRLLIGST